MRIVVMGQSGTVSYTEATSSFVVERLFEQLMRLLALVAAVAVGAGIELSPTTLFRRVAVLVVAFAGINWLIGHRGTCVGTRACLAGSAASHYKRWG